MAIRIHHSRIEDWHSDLLYHAFFADTPYNLDSIAKRFGGQNAAPAQHGTDGLFARQSRGFMGAQWDDEVAFRVETWKKIYPMLYPGAFGAAFSGTRTLHRMMVAIEDAGFIIHPIIVWAFSSGMAKATRVKEDTAFDGHRYGRQAIAPSCEPIVIFQKPYDGRPLDNIVETGAGTLWIEGTRIPRGDKEGYPKNLLLAHSPDCDLSAGIHTENCAIARARLAFWQKQHEQGDYRTKQLTLF